MIGHGNDVVIRTGVEAHVSAKIRDWYCSIAQTSKTCLDWHQKVIINQIPISAKTFMQPKYSKFGLKLRRSEH